MYGGLGSEHDAIVNVENELLLKRQLTHRTQRLRAFGVISAYHEQLHQIDPRGDRQLPDYQRLRVLERWPARELDVCVQCSASTLCGSNALCRFGWTTGQCKAFRHERCSVSSRRCVAWLSGHCSGALCSNVTGYNSCSG